MKGITGISILLLILPVCLHGYPVRELDYWLKKLNNITCNTPVQLKTPVNVQDSSLKDALECFKNELQTFSKNCSEELEQEDGWDIIDSLEKFLNRVAKPTDTRESSDKCASTGYQEMPLQKFSESLKHLIQRVNNQRRAPSNKKRRQI